MEQTKMIKQINDQEDQSDQIECTDQVRVLRPINIPILYAHFILLFQYFTHILCSSVYLFYATLCYFQLHYCCLIVMWSLFLEYLGKNEHLG